MCCYVLVPSIKKPSLSHAILFRLCGVDYISDLKTCVTAIKSRDCHSSRFKT